MSYYSTFRGDVRRIDSKPVTKIEIGMLTDLLINLSGYYLSDNFFEGGETDEITWYDVNRDLKSLSTEFPAYIFEIEQCGEDGSWKKIMACQGRYDIAAGHIVYDDLNEDYVLGEDYS